MFPIDIQDNAIHEKLQQKGVVIWIGGVYGLVLGIITKMYVADVIDPHWPINPRPLLRFSWPILCAIILASAAPYLISSKRWVWYAICLSIAVSAIILEPKLYYLSWYWQGKAGIGDAAIATLTYRGLLHPLSIVLLTLPIVFTQLRHKVIIALVMSLVGACMVGAIGYYSVREEGGRIFMRGFQDAVKERVASEHLQQWATDVLERYENTDMQLPESEIPHFVKNLWVQIPRSIELRSRDGKNGIMISWNSHGMLVGGTDYQTTWKPAYIEQWQPGIYFFDSVR